MCECSTSYRVVIDIIDDTVHVQGEGVDVSEDEVIDALMGGLAGALAVVSGGDADQVDFDRVANELREIFEEYTDIRRCSDED